MIDIEGQGLDQVVEIINEVIEVEADLKGDVSVQNPSTKKTAGPEHDPEADPTTETDPETATKNPVEDQGAEPHPKTKVPQNENDQPVQPEKDPEDLEPDPEHHQKNQIGHDQEAGQGADPEIETD